MEIPSLIHAKHHTHQGRTNLSGAFEPDNLRDLTYLRKPGSKKRNKEFGRGAVDMGSTYSLLIQVGFTKIPYGGYSALAGDDANQNHQSMWRCEVTPCRNTIHPLRLHPDLLWLWLQWCRILVEVLRKLAQMLNIPINGYGCVMSASLRSKS